MNIKEIADLMRTFSEGTFTPDIDGVTYGFGVDKNGKCEIADWSAEVDDYRSETFPSAEEALKKFIVNGRPLSDYDLDAVSEHEA